MFFGICVYLPFAYEEDKESEAALLYIGMTRVKQYLCLSYSGESEYTVYLDGIEEGKLTRWGSG